MTYLRHWAPPRDTLSDHDTFKLAVLNQISSKIDSTLSQIYEGGAHLSLPGPAVVYTTTTCMFSRRHDWQGLDDIKAGGHKHPLLHVKNDNGTRPPRAAGPWTTERSGWMLGIIVTCIYSYLITWAAENKYGPTCLTKMAKQAFINSVEQYHNKSAKRTWMDSITFH